MASGRLSGKLPPLVEALVEAAHWAPSADNSQPWRFVWDGQRLLLHFDEERVKGRTFGPQAHATLMAMGAATENILQMAAHLGAKLEWGFSSEAGHGYAWFDPATDKPHAQFQKALLFERHTNRGNYSKSLLPKELLQQIESSQENLATARVFSGKMAVNQVAALVQHASALRFQNPEVHHLLASSLRFSVEDAQDGLDVRTLGLPPGGGLMLRLVSEWQTMSALNRLGLHQMFASMEANKVKQAGAIVAIIGPGGWQGALSAGRLMEQIWIDLNAQGISVHPFYVVTDQIQRYQAGEGFPPEQKTALAKLEKDVSALLPGTGSMLHMLLRVGYPKKKPLLSKRLSCSRLI